MAFFIDGYLVADTYIIQILILIKTTPINATWYQLPGTKFFHGSEQLKQPSTLGL